MTQKNLIKSSIYKLIKRDLFKGAAIGLGLSLTLATFTALIFTGVIPILRWTQNPVAPLNWNSTQINGAFFANNSNISVKFINTPFGQYPTLNLNYTPSVPTITLEPDLSNVDFQGLEISDEVKALLYQYGFALVKEGYYKDIFQLYDDDYVPGEPKFITTDLCLHTFHILYDTLLQKIEEAHFSTTLKIMLEQLSYSQQSLSSHVRKSAVKDALKKNIAYISVILRLLDEKSSVPLLVKGLVNEEIANINAGVPAISPIFGYLEDYSQYKPRGHYTNNETFEQYFKAMMYAGRMTFLLKNMFGEPNIEQTRMALLLISSFNDSIGNNQLWDYWDRLYEPIKFFVGDSDDLTPKEYYEIWTGIGAPKGDQLADDEIIKNFISLAEDSRPPKINSMLIDNIRDAENIIVGLRLLGQRFTPESYIFQQLVDPKVPGRLIPTALDVFAVLGSDRAQQFTLNDSSQYINFEEQLNNLRKEFTNVSVETWSQNLYMLWLYSLLPLLEPKSAGYPFFMQTDAWTDKTLMTAMGSWTELRHDTILYAKQSCPPYGVGFPYNYVEPYPEVYGRLASLVRLMRQGLSHRGLLFEPFITKLEEAENIFANLTTISIKELENQPITSEELRYLNKVGDALSDLAKFFTEDEHHYTLNQRMALVADVHTDPNTQQVLEVATGNPYTIYVIIQDSEGNLYLTRGGTYSYYEFTMPMTQRLTDEEWHNMLDNNPPTIPEWQNIALPLVDESSLNFCDGLYLFKENNITIRRPIIPFSFL
ncbi:MAG: DUF3160 domain-containing protein [Candidatus Heimdallarchaeaceae archaeon]